MRSAASAGRRGKRLRRSRWLLCRMAAVLIVSATAARHAFAVQRNVTDFAIGEQHPLWLRGGEADTTLNAPNMIMVAEGRVYITDPRGPSVVAIDAVSGQTLWKYSRSGSGPGEMKQPVLLAWHPRGIVVVDNGTRRLYLLSSEGRLLKEQTVPHGAFINSICSFDDGRFVVNIAVMSGPSLFVGRFNSDSSAEFRFPFDFDKARPLDHSVDLVSTAAAGYGGCFASRKAAPGMALLAKDGTARQADFIERVRPRPYKPPEAVRDTADLPIAFSLKAGVRGSAAFVWFGGSSCAGRCIDLYSIPELKYLRTLRLIGRTGLGIHSFDLSDDRVVVLGERNGFPVVAAFRLPPQFGL